jgi:hypothetical protein
MSNLCEATRDNFVKSGEMRKGWSSEKKTKEEKDKPGSRKRLANEKN